MYESWGNIHPKENYIQDKALRIVQIKNKQGKYINYISHMIEIYTTENDRQYLPTNKFTGIKPSITLYRYTTPSESEINSLHLFKDRLYLPPCFLWYIFKLTVVNWTQQNLTFCCLKLRISFCWSVDDCQSFRRTFLEPQSNLSKAKGTMEIVKQPDRERFYIGKRPG